MQGLPDSFHSFLFGGIFEEALTFNGNRAAFEKAWKPSPLTVIEPLLQGLEALAPKEAFANNLQGLEPSPLTVIEPLLQGLEALAPRE